MRINIQMLSGTRGLKTSRVLPEQSAKLNWTVTRRNLETGRKLVWQAVKQIQLQVLAPPLASCVVLTNLTFIYFGSLIYKVETIRVPVWKIKGVPGVVWRKGSLNASSHCCVKCHI